MTFGTFICGECVREHEKEFAMFQSYVKPLFTEAWDGFQLRCVQIGGNKKFFEFLKEYGKERDPIPKKYSSNAANYYRRKLCYEAKNIEFTEAPPPKSA